MRFVDEYRDAEKARALAAQITALCEPGRHYKFMEVCGGHTHTIYKHGLEDYLPESITLVHGPGHQGHPGLTRPTPRRLHRPRPRLHRHRLPALRLHRCRARETAGVRRV